ncbi:MAG: CHASE3 domain-containing protein [Vicinamibacterales bacterium]
MSVWPAVIALGTVLVLGLFLATVLRNVTETRALRDQTFQVERTLEVQRVLDGILVAQAEADAAARAYLLTQSTAALDRLHEQTAAEQSRLDRLAELTRDNPTQASRIGPLREAVRLRRDRLQQLVEVRKGRTIEGAMQEARAVVPPASSDDVRALISEMEAEESRLLAARRSQASVMYARAVSGRVGSGIVSAVLLISIVLTAGLHARSKARREDALVRSEQRAREAAAREQEARADAERANRQKDQFLAVLSHELRARHSMPSSDGRRSCRRRRRTRCRRRAHSRRSAGTPRRSNGSSKISSTSRASSPASCRSSTSRSISVRLSPPPSTRSVRLQKRRG